MEQDIPIILTTHAKRRLAQKRITTAQIEQAIRRPHAVLPQDNGNLRAVRKGKKENLVVIFTKGQCRDEPAHIVVTAFYSSKSTGSPDDHPSRL